MVIASLLAAVGIYQDSAILIVGAMVVGPEFGRSRGSASPSSTSAARWPCARP
jgi:hypothetical protein